MAEVEVFDFVQILFNPKVDGERREKSTKWWQDQPSVFYFQLCVLQA